MNNYFSHDSNARNSDKLIPLRMRLGAEGYGIYFMILERLREEPEYTSVKDYNMIAFDLRVDTGKVKSVIEDFGLFVFTEDGKYFYSESFKRRMTQKDEKSKKLSEAGKKGNERRWKNDTDNQQENRHPIATQSPPDRICDENLSQEKKRKEKESKVKKKEENIPPTIPHVETRDVFEKFKDEMLSDDFWVEQQAMTSGIGNKFTNVVSVALAKFFSWIVSTGNEETIKTLNDAKRRFFYWWRDHGKPEFEKEYTSTSVDTSRIALGIGVWIDGGKKFYGSRENPREIPLNAPYRPAQDAKWDATNERWTISGG